MTTDGNQTVITVRFSKFNVSTYNSQYTFLLLLQFVNFTFQWSHPSSSWHFWTLPPNSWRIIIIISCLRSFFVQRENHVFPTFPVSVATGKYMTVGGTAFRIYMDMFLWNKEIFANYSHRQKHRPANVHTCVRVHTHTHTHTRTHLHKDILFPQDQRHCLYKRDQRRVIVLNFLWRVSFPVLHHVRQLFPWRDGQWQWNSSFPNWVKPCSSVFHFAIQTTICP